MLNFWRTAVLILIAAGVIYSIYLKYRYVNPAERFNVVRGHVEFLDRETGKWETAFERRGRWKREQAEREKTDGKRLAFEDLLRRE